MTRRAALAAALLALAAAAHSAPGSTAANFLKVGVGARPVALGEAYSAIADDANAVYYNPAGLAFLERQEVTLMHNKFLPGVSHEWGAYAFPSAYYGTFAGAFTMLRVAPFDAYDVNDQRNGSVSASDVAGHAAYALELPWPDGLAAGASFKYVSSRLATYSAQAGALDAGLLWREPGETDRWRLAVTIRNVGPDMSFINEAFPMPLEARLGATYEASLAPVWPDARWLVTAEAAAPRDRNPFASTGVEFKPVPEFALRVGWRQNQDAGVGIAGGIGLRSLEKGFTADWFPEIGLDYAFVDHGPLEQTHRVSVTLRFGIRKGERREGSDRSPPKFHHLIRY